VRLCGCVFEEPNNGLHNNTNDSHVGGTVAQPRSASCFCNYSQTSADNSDSKCFIIFHVCSGIFFIVFRIDSQSGSEHICTVKYNLINIDILKS
jgi:hypothetical protein